MNTPAPRRLVEESGELGELMRDASRQYSRGLDANRAWQRHLAHKDRPELGRWLPASVVFALAAAALVVGIKFGRSSNGLVALPEPVIAKHVEEPKLEPAKPALNVLEKEPAPAQPERARPAPRDTRGSTPAPAEPKQPSEAAEPKVDCLGFARSGDAKRAAVCFEGQAAGSGLSAEVGLYELARLRRDALGDSAGALVALDEYTRRFPNGSLTAEVRFSRLELLARLGRAQEAITASDALLASRYGSERAAELRLLRGNLYLRSLGDPARAAVEYEAASRGSSRIADEAAYLHALSLEKAGNIAAARTAYERYAERPGARHESEAKAKLKALSAE